MAETIILFYFPSDIKIDDILSIIAELKEEQLSRVAIDTVDSTIAEKGTLTTPDLDHIIKVSVDVASQSGFVLALLGFIKTVIVKYIDTNKVKVKLHQDGTFEFEGDRRELKDAFKGFKEIKGIDKSE